MAGPAAGKDHAAGPWNLGFTGALQLESNSNVFYAESNPESDIVGHIIHAFSAKYEELQNVIFSAELQLDSMFYIS